MIEILVLVLVGNNYVLEIGFVFFKMVLLLD